MGVKYVPGGPISNVAERIDVGLSPVDQLTEFLNDHGNSIKDWEIIDGTHSSRELPIIYRIEVKE